MGRWHLGLAARDEAPVMVGMDASTPFPSPDTDWTSHQGWRFLDEEGLGEKEK